jgi:hypothetical protein
LGPHRGRRGPRTDARTDAPVEAIEAIDETPAFAVGRFPAPRTSASRGASSTRRASLGFFRCAVARCVGDEASRARPEPSAFAGDRRQRQRLELRRSRDRAERHRPPATSRARPAADREGGGRRRNCRPSRRSWRSPDGRRLDPSPCSLRRNAADSSSTRLVLELCARWSREDRWALSFQVAMLRPFAGSAPNCSL